MSYMIVQKSIKEFISMDTALPRFQRKQTWGPKDNFKLCISVFKDYPVGVVILNNQGKFWVLDGRQRLNALTNMSKSPIEVYYWARKFIGFKNGDANDVVAKLYWEKIEDYLSSDFEEDVYDEKKYKEKDLDEDGNQNSIETDDEDEKSNDVILSDHTFDQNEQRNNLEVLLKYILLVHNIKKVNRVQKTKLERVFDFSKVINNLEYYQIVNGSNSFVEGKLIKLINDLIIESKEAKNRELITEEGFVQHFVDARYIDKESDKYADFKKIAKENWSDIKNTFEVIDAVNRVLSNSGIGIIEITNASDLDAQNMFSLVNTGGTLLTAEEILSAKPFWNKAVDNPSNDAKLAISKLYTVLKVETPSNVFRWDLAATLMERIDKDGIVFEKNDENSFAEQTTLGFKLISAILCEGISSAVVSKIEKYRDFDWNNDYESLVLDLNTLIDLISDQDYFKTMKAWKQSIMSITSNTIALEFITIMYKKWIECGKKIGDTTAVKKLKREAISLLDRLIYEYSNKLWRGSSDSKLASDIKDMDNRVIPLDYDKTWASLLNDLSVGIINGEQCTQNLIKPILYHSKCINIEYPARTSDSYDLDHIYPQALFKSNPNIDQNYKDSLTNLQILSSSANESKKDKKLTSIDDESIKNEIEKSSYIPISDFEKYSDINNIDNLRKLRMEEIQKIYSEKRDTIINN